MGFLKAGFLQKQETCIHAIQKYICKVISQNCIALFCKDLVAMMVYDRLG